MAVLHALYVTFSTQIIIPFSICYYLNLGKMNNKINDTVNFTGVLIDDRPEWGDQVLRHKDQSVVHPIKINEFLAWILGTICLFGFPLNFEIIIHILYDQTMRLKPKYIIQLAIVFSGVLILLAIGVIIFNFCFGPYEILCHLFVSFFLGISYNCFILNYFLYLIECFVAIAFPLWHRVYVTPRPVVYGLIGLNLILALAMEWPFICGMIPVRCAIQPSHGQIINSVWPVLFILSLVFLCINYAITWTHLPRSSLPSAAAVAATVAIPSIITSSPSPADDVDGAVDYPNQSPIEEEEGKIVEIIIILNDQTGDEATIGKLVPATESAVITMTPDPSTISLSLEMEIQNTIQQRRRRLSVIPEVSETVDQDETSSIDMTYSGDSGRSDDYEDHCTTIPDDVSCTPFSPIEWKSIKMFLIGVVPLFLIPLPLFLFYFFFHLYCEQLDSSPSTNGQQQQLEQCSDLNWLMSYLFFILVSLHTLVNPITSLWLNKDFQRPSSIRRQRMQVMLNL